MKKSRRTYNGVHLNKKSNTQDVVEQSLTAFLWGALWYKTGRIEAIRNGVLLPYQTLQGIWISVAGQVPREKNAGGRGTDYKRGNTVIHSADTLSLACENHQRG